MKEILTIDDVKKVAIKEIIVSSCDECPHRGYTESNWYCKKMRLGKYAFREIVDIHKVHELCPLDDLVW